jgi:hypothetical protein
MPEKKRPTGTFVLRMPNLRMTALPLSESSG